MTNAATPFSILYLVHDLSDAAVARRVAMLRAGGADVTVMGFRRADASIADVAGTAAIDLGQTHNGNFIQRILAVIRVILHIQNHRAAFLHADLIIARNLEMLAIAVRGRQLGRRSSRLVYEVLDIHRLMIGHKIPARILRALEGFLCRRVSLVLTSSPAFIREYFERQSRVKPPIRLLENKVFKPDQADILVPVRPQPPPWVIGWFGIIRCRKSLRILADLVRAMNGQVQVVIRGRPALDQMPDFHGVVASTPGLSYQGPYQSPDDLPNLYGGVHFTWAIDYFEEGMNSSWLLPNRIYEGGLYAAVPLAQAGTEIAHKIQAMGTGVTLADPMAESLRRFFTDLTPAVYQSLQDQAAGVSPTEFVDGLDNARALVNDLRGIAHV